MIQRMGLGSYLIAWMETIYNHPKAWIKMNNMTSEPLILSRGVHQSCPLSPFIFNICMEAFAMAIRQDDHIKGVTCNGQQLKLAQNVDDTLLFFLLDPKASFLALTKKLTYYSKISGYKIHLDISEMMALNLTKQERREMTIMFPALWKAYNI